jgi:simple sugar transport system substrate-binding protein
MLIMAKRRQSSRSTKSGVSRIAAIVAAMLLAAVALAACGGSSGSSSSAAGTTVAVENAASETPELEGGESLSGKKVLFIHSNDSGNTFDTPVVTGSKAAAKLTGLELETQFSDNDATKLRSIVQSGIAKKVAGIIVSIPDASLNGPLCEAQKAGIMVIAWNQDGATGPAQDCISAYVGQDFITSGKVLGERMVEEGLIGEGDEVFCPVEYADATYAAQRSEGVNEGLKSVGAKCDVVGVGADEGKAQATETQYLLGHSDTKAILALGGPSFSSGISAVKQANLSDVALGGFDLTPSVIKGIESGEVTVAVDQQPYSQGYMSTTQMALYLKYGLYPSDIPTGGTGLVDKSNVELVGSLVPTYR